MLNQYIYCVGGGPLLSCRPDLLQLLSAALHSRESRIRMVAIHVLTQLAKIDDLLNMPQACGGDIFGGRGMHVTRVQNGCGRGM